MVFIWNNKKRLTAVPCQYMWVRDTNCVHIHLFAE